MNCLHVSVRAGWTIHPPAFSAPSSSESSIDPCSLDCGHARAICHLRSMIFRSRPFDRNENKRWTRDEQESREERKRDRPAGTDGVSHSRHSPRGRAAVPEGRGLRTSRACVLLCSLLCTMRTRPGPSTSTLWWSSDNREVLQFLSVFL